MHLHSPFGMEEQRLWPVLDEMLGYPTEWQPGRLDAAFDETTLTGQKDAIGPEIEKGFEVEFLDGDQVRALVPLASKRIVGGTYRHYGGHANPQRTVQAYAWAMQDLGGRIYQHHKVIGVLIAGTQVAGVETDQGSFVADFVVDAAGPSTGMIAEMAGVSLPLAHARVEQIVTEPLPSMFSGNFIGDAEVKERAQAWVPTIMRFTDTDVPTDLEEDASIEDEAGETVSGDVTDEIAEQAA